MSAVSSELVQAQVRATLAKAVAKALTKARMAQAEAAAHYAAAEAFEEQLLRLDAPPPPAPAAPAEPPPAQSGAPANQAAEEERQRVAADAQAELTQARAREAELVEQVTQAQLTIEGMQQHGGAFAQLAEVRAELTKLQEQYQRLIDNTAQETVVRNRERDEMRAALDQWHQRALEAGRERDDQARKARELQDLLQRTEDALKEERAVGHRELGKERRLREQEAEAHQAELAEERAAWEKKLTEAMQGRQAKPRHRDTKPKTAPPPAGWQSRVRHKTGTTVHLLSHDRRKALCGATASYKSPWVSAGLEPSNCPACLQAAGPPPARPVTTQETADA